MIGVLNENKNPFKMFSATVNSVSSNDSDTIVTIGPTTDVSKSLSISFVAIMASVAVATCAVVVIPVDILTLMPA